MNDFDFDVMQKKRLARMSKYRKGGIKSKKCPMSTDHMTRKQWEERCGEVYSYKMNEPKTWKQFKALPTDIQKQYLTYLVENYNANATSLAMMFDVRPSTVHRHIEINQLGLTFKVGNSMNAAQKEKWMEFLGNSQKANDVAEQKCEALERNVDADEVGGRSPGMEMKQFSLTFQGEIDVNMIANSILGIVGNGTVGKIEIMCTM